MKRMQRINRVTRKQPRRPNRLLPLVLVIGGAGALLQLLVLGVLVTAAGAGAYTYYKHISTAGLNKLKTAPLLQNVQPTRILDRHGHLLMEISDTSRGLHQNEPLSRIPAYMKEGVVAIEDHTFWSNPGIDPHGIVGALYRDLKHQGTFGASTITQQVIKMLVLGNQETPQRKIQEMMIALAAARPGSGFSKQKILWLYLNNSFFGSEAYGVEAAARVYFGKHIWQLDLAQCAMLSGLLQAPTAYDPLGPYGTTYTYPRTQEVLGNMQKYGYISALQQRAAMAELYRFKFTQPHWTIRPSSSIAPYWTNWITHLLTYKPSGVNDLGWYTDPTLAAIVTNAGGLAAGLTITTTLDLDTYQNAQSIMRNTISTFSSYYNVNDAAVVQIDPHTAECVAMVGGLDWNSSATGSQYNMAAQPRSPGSSFKVFTYLTAFKDPQTHWSPSTMLVDKQTSWPDPSEPGGQYTPQNYDQTFHGAVTVRIALANSFNIPAVETINQVGVDNVLKTAEEMGVWYLRDHHSGAGLSLTLGGKAVPLWQMAQAYNTFANGGVFRPMQSVLGISNAAGKTLWTYRVPRGVQVVAPQYAYLITSILKDNYARVLAFGPNSNLQLGPDANLSVNWPAAAKTGTSQNFRDNLTIGYTPNLLSAVWVGNPDFTAMNGVEGVTGAGPIWQGLMEYSIQHLNLPWADFPVPPGVMLARVSSSGYLADRSTAWPITDVFAAGSLPHLYDPGYGPNYNNYLQYRHYTNNFSLDGGTTTSLVSGAASLVPTTGASPLGGTTGISGTTTGPPSGYTGTLSQRPSPNDNLCGGRSWTYTSVYIKGQLRWQYTCQ